MNLKDHVLKILMDYVDNDEKELPYALEMMVNDESCSGFFLKNYDEICSIVGGWLEDSGETIDKMFGDSWDKTDICCRENNNRSLLGCFGFEHVCNQLLNEGEENAY